MCTCVNFKNIAKIAQLMKHILLILWLQRRWSIKSYNVQVHCFVDYYFINYVIIDQFTILQVKTNFMINRKLMQMWSAYRQFIEKSYKCGSTNLSTFILFVDNCIMWLANVWTRYRLGRLKTFILSAMITSRERE